MPNTIQVRRGANASLPTLNAGEIGFSTDTHQTYIGDGATNHEILTSIGHLMRVSSTTVAFNAVAATTLYTVPTGWRFVPVMAIILAGSNANATDVTFGKASALTDWLGTIQLDNLDAAGEQVKVEVANANPPTKSKSYAAGVVFQIDVTVAAGGATNYVDLFGYLRSA